MSESVWILLDNSNKLNLTVLSWIFRLRPAASHHKGTWSLKGSCRLPWPPPPVLLHQRHLWHGAPAKHCKAQNISTLHTFYITLHKSYITSYITLYYVYVSTVYIRVLYHILTYKINCNHKRLVRDIWRHQWLVHLDSLAVQLNQVCFYWEPYIGCAQTSHHVEVGRLWTANRWKFFSLAPVSATTAEKAPFSSAICQAKGTHSLNLDRKPS